MHHYTFKSKVHFWVILSVLFLVAFMAELVLAQSDPVMAEPDKGTICYEPTFSFNWYDTNLFELDCKAIPSGKFIVTIKEAPVNKKIADESRSHELGEVLATPEGQSYVVNLDDFRLIETGGKVIIEFESVNPENVCDERKKGAEIVSVFEKHRLHIDVGYVFALGNEGKFLRKAEFSLNSFSRYTSFLSGIANFRYSTFGAIDSGKANLFNPFHSEGGTFEVELYGLLHPGYKQWQFPVLSFITGVGIHTIQGDSSEPLQARPRSFVGFRVQTPGYNTGRRAVILAKSRGFFQVGYSYDDFWRNTEKNRFFFEGQLEIPGLGGEFVRIILRTKGDLPIRLKSPLKIESDGPSDIRISVLSQIDPKLFKAIFGGIK